MAEIQGSYNRVFIYLPFVLEDAGSAKEAYAQAKQAFVASDAWEEVNQIPRYLFRYICDKYDANSPDCQCHHYKVCPEVLEEMGLGTDHLWALGKYERVQRWQQIPHMRRFAIDAVHCYVFRTSINVMVVQLHYVGMEATDLAAQLFQLKNVNNARFSPCEQGRLTSLASEEHLRSHGLSLYDLAGGTLALTPLSSAPKFFFYANEGRERANIFVHAEASEAQPGDLDAARLMYYLANCYSRGFDYHPVRSLPVRSYWATPSTLWGCSSEALACLVLPARAGDGLGFLTSMFRNNIGDEYQFLYLLLLHQKYAYYRLLMRIGAGQRRNLAQLEEFHRELEVFRANFVFVRVSETQQYQTLYETVYQELRLAEMDRDVAEPIAALAQLRQEEDDQAERESARRVERAMNTVAVLAGVSATLDGLDLINNYLLNFLPSEVLHAVSLAVAAVLLLVTVRAALDLRRR